MSEEIKEIALEPEVPTLTLDEVPTLTLGIEEPTPENAAALAPAPEEVAANDGPGYLEQPNLSEAELATVDEFSKKINLKDTGIILQYGAASQKKIADFSENALEGVRAKDLGEVGDMITGLVSELKGFDADAEEKGFLGIFKKKAASISKLKARFDTTENNVDRIVTVLEGHQNQLLKDIVMLDKMYETNLIHFKELTMYILAGKKCLENERTVTLAELKAKAEQTGLAEDAQAANDFASVCDRFEKKLHDLELTRTISIQMAPQIRLIQNGDALMSEKIQSTIINTIPLWKNQMVLALGIRHSQQAVEAQQAVSELTNELLKKNADALKIGATEIAAESERSIIDIETVRYTNEQLISTLNEVIRIQDEGRAKRLAAENELGRIENELRDKLLDIRQ